MRSKLEDLKELRDLVRSLGRGGGWGPLRRAPIQYLDMKARGGPLPVRHHALKHPRDTCGRKCGCWGARPVREEAVREEGWVALSACTQRYMAQEGGSFQVKRPLQLSGQHALEQHHASTGLWLRGDSSPDALGSAADRGRRARCAAGPPRAAAHGAGGAGDARPDAQRRHQPPAAERGRQHGAREARAPVQAALLRQGARGVVLSGKSCTEERMSPACNLVRTQGRCTTTAGFAPLRPCAPLAAARCTLCQDNAAARGGVFDQRCDAKAQAFPHRLAQTPPSWN